MEKGQNKIDGKQKSYKRRDGKEKEKIVKKKPLGEKQKILDSNFICGRSAINVTVIFYIFLCYLSKRTVARQKFQAKRFFRYIYFRPYYNYTQVGKTIH
jgi:hypothetical protein